MDPVEERDIEKVLHALDDPRVQEKIASILIGLPAPASNSIVRIVPKKNVMQPEENSGG